MPTYTSIDEDAAAAPVVSLKRQVWLEFALTTLLVTVLQINGAFENSLGPLAMGGLVFMMIGYCGHISGAFFNPAVSTTLFITTGRPVKEFVLYVTSQFAGGFAGALLGWFIAGKQFAPAAIGDTDVSQIFMSEMLFAFLICYGTREKHSKTFVEVGALVGLIVMLAGFSCLEISGGGAFNPAVGLGLAMVDWMNMGSMNSSTWCYIVGPFAGGILAAFMPSLE